MKVWVKYHCPDAVYFKEIPLLAILTRNIYSNFSPEFLSICEYNSGKKPAYYRPFKNEHFVRAGMEKMMDHQCKENGARNIYSNYNQMRACVECSPNQKNYTLSTFPSSNRRNFKDPEMCRPLLYLHFTRVLQFSSTSPRFQDGYHQMYVYK